MSLPITRQNSIFRFLSIAVRGSYTITGECVNVIGDVIYVGRMLREIPVKFGRVTGGFDVRNNWLTDFTNFPDEVGGTLNVSGNQIDSLEGFPEKFNDIAIRNNIMQMHVMQDLIKIMQDSKRSFSFSLVIYWGKLSKIEKIKYEKYLPEDLDLVKYFTNLSIL